MEDIRKDLMEGKIIFLALTEHDDGFLKLVPIRNGIRLFEAYVKFQGKDEYQVPPDSDLVLDAMLNGVRVTESQYLG